MPTYFFKKGEIKRKTHQLDAQGKSLGRLASEIVTLLLGKNKASYTPNVDVGDFVVVKNVEQIKFTGNKFLKKVYYRYSGYPGGIKTEKLAEIFKKNPGEVLRRAVFGMLPENRLRPDRIKRLKIYK